MENVASAGVAKRGVSLLTWALIGALLFLRIPFLAGLRIILGNPSPLWLEEVFEAGTFLLTAILIWVERERLGDFHIPPLALALILVFKPLVPVFEWLMGLRGSPTSFPQPLSFMYLAIVLGLLAALRRAGWKWQPVAKPEWKWLGWGLAAGLGLLALLSFPTAFSIRTLGGSFEVPLAAWLTSFLRIPQQLGYAAITEEPLFRGFLWGALRKSGWKDGAILVFQALLFMLGHAYYIQQVPLSFWVVVPVGGLVLGWLAWRSRSIASSMAAHAMLNAFGYTLGQVVGKIIFR